MKLAEKEFENGNLTNGMRLTDLLLEEESCNVDALILKTRIYYKQQKWGDALNTLNKVLEVEPKHPLALQYQQIINSILDYWNKDNYNP